MNDGLIHVYYGSGKGKTTAAVGLAFRCAGQGYPVIVSHFLKGRVSGESLAARSFPNMTVLLGNETTKFTNEMNTSELSSLGMSTVELMAESQKLAVEENARLLVLDEVLDACDVGLLPYAVLEEFLADKPRGLEVALTGRALPAWLRGRADYITRMESEKHPYDRGISARKGIEY